MYLHDLSPFLWRITDDFGIRWYGFSFMLGLVLAFLIIRWMTYRQRSGMSSGTIVDFVMSCALGALVGGRLGYCLFYAPDLALKFKAEFPFWGVLALGDGGMSSHGGVIGVTVAATLFAMQTGISRLYLYDLAAFASTLGIFFGRIANFINSEMIGRPSEPGFPFSVKFPSEIYQWVVNDFKRLSELVNIASQISTTAGQQWSIWLENFQSNEEAKISVNETLGKIVEAVQNGNENIRNSLAPLLVERHPSQLYAAAGEGLFIFIFLFLLWYRPRRPGVIGATFLILSAVVRLVDEQFRQPDPLIGYQLLGLTLGQWLSFVMLIAGLTCWFIWGRRETLPASGWGHGQSVSLHRR